jgi:hypothetical protein
MSISPHDVYNVEVDWKSKTKEDISDYFRLVFDFQQSLAELGWREALEGKTKAK